MCAESTRPTVCGTRDLEPVILRDCRVKADVAHQLHVKHGLPDVSALLRELNDARKATAYGDIEAPELDAEEVATRIEEFVEAAKAVLG